MATIAGQTVWSEWIDRAKHADFYPIALKLGARLKRTTTSEFTGPCPFCGGTDRFSLNVKKNVCNCRKCDIAGDVVHFVEIMTGCGFIEACEFINQTPRPDRSRDETLQEKTDRLAARAKWQAEHQEREEERRRIEEAKAKRDEEAIASILAPERAVALAGTLGEAYLQRARPDAAPKAYGRHQVRSRSRLLGRQGQWRQEHRPPRHPARRRRHHPEL